MPAWITDLQGIGAILSGIAAIIAAIYARSASKEMKPDHGSSMRDAITMMDDRLLVRIQPRELFFIWHPSITKCRG